MLDITKVPSPCYVMEEDLLRKNLSLIKSVADRAGVEIILAFKAFAMWKTFPIFREYIRHTTASSVYEARLAFEEFGSKAHTYSPAYTDENFPEFLKYSNHITFNSLSQFERFYPQAKAYWRKHIPNRYLVESASIRSIRKWKWNYITLVRLELVSG